MESFNSALECVVRGTYVNQGLQNRQSRQRIFETLLTNKRLPLVGLNDQTIEFIVSPVLELNGGIEVLELSGSDREIISYGYTVVILKPRIRDI